MFFYLYKFTYLNFNIIYFNIIKKKQYNKLSYLQYLKKIFIVIKLF